MAQLERFPRQVNASRSLASPTVDKALRVSGGEFSRGSPTSPGGANSPLSEDDNGAPQKKSVLSKVKEKAKKLRHSLSKKKHDDGNATPTWGASVEDEEEEDAEYLGAPMYESELAPEAYKENARQHPRATPVIAENHRLHNALKSRGEMDRQRPLRSSAESKRANHHHHHHHHHHLAAATSSLGSTKTMSGNGAEKLSPTYAKGSDAAGLCISSKMQGLTVSKPLDTQTPSLTPASSRRSPLSVTTTAPLTPPATASKLSPVTSKAPRFSSAPSTPRKSSSPSTSSTLHVKNVIVDTGGGEQTWDKGVTVREYFKSKLEPGEDEKALSQVISEAISPRRTPGDVGVMEKVREAVTSLLRNEEPQQYSVRSPTVRASSSQSPVPSSNVQQVGEEENQGRILQTN